MAIYTVATIVGKARQGTILPMAEFTDALDYRAMVRERDALQAAFDDRTASLTRSADECIALTNERDALRAALLALMSAPLKDSGEAVANARKVLWPTDTATAKLLRSRTVAATLQCVNRCSDPATMIGAKGYAYCAACGTTRRLNGVERTRKLEPSELRKLIAGQTIAY